MSGLGLSTSCLQVISSHTPKNVAKSKNKRGAKVPDGAARYVPTSPEFLDILEERSLKQSPAKKMKKNVVKKIVVEKEAKKRVKKPPAKTVKKAKNSKK